MVLLLRPNVQNREKSLDNGKNIEWFAWRAAGNTGDEDDDDDDNENKSHAPGWYYNTGNAIIIRNIAIRRCDERAEWP
ncbi:hypothetical protein MCOR32_006193 [Pyricularia oryzae]|nr:hypothetical protein MCOR32_006193 [Pyricularia oryzae]KAI6496111.1 hypothetical protein MCOR13_007075 [Pyricularia oryzae]